MIEIRNVAKTYGGGVRALDNVSLDIPKGLFGLLGPNGAGKSTLMRTIATLQDPDQGTIRLDGVDTVADKDAMRRTLGYLPQEFGFYPNLSAETTLDHFAELKGFSNRKDRRETVAHLLRQVNLYEVRRKPVGGFSGGMKQRLGIAVALLGQPKVVIVDEPTAGLDPTERNRFLNLLSEAGETAAVILSTHIVEDVEELCERVAIISTGTVVASGDPAQVIATASGKLWRKQATPEETQALEQTARVVAKRLVAGRPVVTIASDTDPGNGFAPVNPTLEDAYFLHTSGSTVR
jgi:ABC-2 type transport system ATP-binding protein